MGYFTVSEEQVAFLLPFFRAETIDGVICTTRTYMEIVYEIIKKTGKAVPNEISMVGYDDPFWDHLVDPQITVISEKRTEMGEIAVNLLFDRIEGRRDSNFEKIVLDTDFIVRQT